MGEEWVDVVGYEGLYKINRQGKVVRIKDNKVMGEYKDRAGYIFCKLTKNGVGRTELKHRLIAKAFIPNPNNLPEINHKDENKENNSIENLEWCDRKYNMNYGTCVKRASRKKEKKVCCYDMNLNLVKVYNSIKETSKDGYEPKHVSDVALRKRRTHKNMIWRCYNEGMSLF